MKAALHLKFWIIAVLVVFFVGPAAIAPQYAENAIRSDIDRIYAVMGEVEGAAMVARANSWYESIFGKLNKKVEPLEAEEARTRSGYLGVNTAFARLSTRLLKTMRLSSYQFILRLSLGLTWLPAVLFIMLGSVIDGLVQHRVKRESFGDINPIVFNGMRHGIVAVIGLSLVLGLLPIATYPLYWPIVGVVLAFMMMAMLSNMPHISERF